MPQITGQSWEPFTRDDEGHRIYTLCSKILHLTTDGPATILTSSGLPQPGATWQFSNDFDTWAWCRPNATIKPLAEGEPNTISEVRQVFSTKPPDINKMRCQDNPIEDPILELPKINGSSVKYTREMVYDNDGNAIQNSAWEQIHGPQVEFDANRSTVTVEFNVAVLNLAFIDAYLNTVNDNTLWGYAPRCVKFSSRTFERKYYGFCEVYYTLKLEFEIDTNTWDRDLLDEGTKVLNGGWALTGPVAAWETRKIQPGNVVPDPQDPTHFIAFLDRNNNPCKVILDGSGLPSGVTIVGTGTIICNTQNIIGDDQNFGLNGNQPPQPSQLVLTVTDATPVISNGIIIIAGQDADGQDLTDTFDVADNGTFTYTTKNVYATITDVTGQDFEYEPGPTATMSVATLDVQHNPGNIHVEYYEEQDLADLGIPLTF